MRKKMKIFIGIVIGIFLSGGMSYVIASTLINSKDVVYEDNSNLAADNVQDAIDGTCSKIDTRLSTIEDNLYNVKNMYISKTFTSSTSPIYTGVSITFPKDSYCAVNISLNHHTGRPKGIFLSTSSSTLYSESGTSVIYEKYSGDSNLYTYSMYMPYINYFERETTLYVWSIHSTEGIGAVVVSGFCTTKYK